MHGAPRRSIYRALKRLLDFTLAFAVLVAFSPFLLLLALAIYLDNPGPIFYVHERVGQGGRPFPFYKFRTMVVGADRIGKGYEIDRDDARITRLGHFLRRWHIDEVPQLLNVLKGEMSIVGPRPTLAYQVAEYSAEQRRRLEVPPGLTGLAQVKGLNALTWQERIRWDVYYVDHASLWLDLTIMLRTFGAVAGEDNTYGHGWESSQAAARTSSVPENPDA
jgi:lipopolysaccharide/colanic/teichoic acid biosynthesis glycosyltransferase